MIDIHYGDNLPILRSMPDEGFDLIYVDPPFNTGKVQTRQRLRTLRDQEHGDRTGFAGKRYRTVKLGSRSFEDGTFGWARVSSPLPVVGAGYRVIVD